jgi:hypothetical protein
VGQASMRPTQVAIRGTTNYYALVLEIGRIEWCFSCAARRGLELKGWTTE